jgi:tRNA (cmo5U34)-methyltransferase
MHGRSMCDELLRARGCQVSLPDDVSARVAAHFSRSWQSYDDQIKRAIPYYESALDLLIEVVRRTSPGLRVVVDIGVGTGQLASRVLTAFPGAELIGIDIVPEYVELARQRLAAHRSRVQLTVGDVTTMELPSDADAYLTTFALHHIDDAHKQRVYDGAAAALRPDGVLINADFVGSGSAYFGAVFDDLRMSLMAEAGMSEADIRTHYVEHRALELPTPLDVQLDWLRDTGLSDVECFWKYLNLAMFGGRKPTGA